MEEQTKQEWLMPSDIKEYETRKPEEMLNKYLARPVVKKWIEDFKDEETGEIVSIERNEVLFNSGTEITQDVLVKLRFSMDADGIETVCVTELPPVVKRETSRTSHIVTISNSITSAKVYVQGCRTPEDAAQLVCDYHSVYPMECMGRGSFFVVESKTTADRFIFSDELPCGGIMGESREDRMEREKAIMGLYLDTNIPFPEAVIEDRAWKTNLNRWYADMIKEKYTKTTSSFIIMAPTALLAIISVRQYLTAHKEQNVVWEFKSIGNGNMDFAIPKEYIKTWEEKHYEQ